MISEDDFVAGTPVTYKSPRGVVVIWFDPSQGIGIKTKKGVDWSDVFTEKKARATYVNMKLGDVQVKSKDEDLSIPKTLKRDLPKDWDKRRKQIIDEERNPTLRVTTGNGSGVDFHKPKGMSNEEWKAIKDKKQAAKDEKKRARLTELKANKLPKVSAREGMVDMAAIAQELGKEPFVLRDILRKKQYPKPGVGWAWKEGKELDNVKELLRKALAEDGGKTPSKKGGGKQLKIPPAGGDTDWSLSGADKAKWTKESKKREEQRKEEPEPVKSKEISKAAKAKKK